MPKAKHQTLTTFRITRLAEAEVTKLAARWEKEVGRGKESISHAEVCRRLVSMALCAIHPHSFIGLSRIARMKDSERGDGWDEVCGSTSQQVNEFWRESGRAPSAKEIIAWIDEQADKMEAEAKRKVSSLSIVNVDSRSPQPA